jgi:hypothetical protein
MCIFLLIIQIIRYYIFDMYTSLTSLFSYKHLIFVVLTFISFYSNQYLYEVMVYEKVRFFFEHIFLYIRLSEEINIRRDAFCFRTMSDYYIIKVVYYANTFVKKMLSSKDFFDKWNFTVKKDKINFIEMYHFFRIWFGKR